MDLLIDTNVLLNIILKRKGYEEAICLFKKIKEKDCAAFITASTVTDLFYIMKRTFHDAEKTYVAMEYIFKLVSVLSVTGEDIKDAFGCRWNDFEDCVQYVTAKNNQIDYIVTENTKDYADDLDIVLTPQECILKLKG